MRNIEELRQFLSTAVDDFKANRIDVTKANAYANLTGKILTSIGIQLMYDKMAEKASHIEFMEEAKFIEAKVVKSKLE